MKQNSIVAITIITNDYVHLRRMVSKGNKVCIGGLARSTSDDMLVQPDAKSRAQFVVHVVLTRGEKKAQKC
jgi:hypothetical protein